MPSLPSTLIVVTLRVLLGAWGGVLIGSSWFDPEGLGRVLVGAAMLHVAWVAECWAAIHARVWVHTALAADPSTPVTEVAARIAAGDGRPALLPPTPSSAPDGTGYP